METTKQPTSKPNPPTDEPLKDLLERWETHWLGDGAADLAAATCVPTETHAIPRKPCAVEHRSQNAAEHGNHPSVEQQVGGKTA
jgi:hypothetical protein